MSSPRALAATPAAEAGVAKRGRKARPSFTDDDKQRERKRAMDRKAQRVSREKTRSHIAHLEKMVGILCEKNESEATTELMAEVSRLNAEIDRLRKIIETIKSVLRADSFEMEVQSQRNNQNSNGSRSGSKEPNNKLKTFPKPEIENKTQQQPPQYQPQQQQQQQYHPVFDELDEFTNNHHQNLPMSTPQLSSATLAPAKEASPNQTTQQPLPTATGLNFTPAWSDSIIPRRRPPNSRSHSVSAIPSLPSALWAQLYPSIPPSISTAPLPPPPSHLPCKIWQKSNRIYAKMFDIKATCAGAADEITTGMLFKAVKEGWGSLGDMAGNPVLSVLRKIDQEVFSRLDRVTRVAMMHKSHLLMKYFLHSDETNWSRMPIWQRPVPSQSALQHPIAIDFFAWPSLRDRLVSHHSTYFTSPPSPSSNPSSTTTTPATTGIAPFSLAYQKHFRFSWPFTFDDSYIQHPDGSYEISPLFERYHADIQYWGVERQFFDEFPEFRGVMSEAHTHEDQEGGGRSVSPIDVEASGDKDAGLSNQGEGKRVVELQDGEGLDAQRRPSVVGSVHGSGNGTATASSRSTVATSPEEVDLGNMDVMDVDVEMLGQQHIKAEEGGQGQQNPHQHPHQHQHQHHNVLNYEFTAEERQAATGMGYETADAYMLELFNDLPCC